MADYAHNYTDKQLEALEKRFQSVYRQAEKEVTEKLEKYLDQFQKKDAAKRKLLESGKISQADYDKWRLGQYMSGRRWREMRDKLAQDYTNANQNAIDAMNRRLPDVFAENTNYSTYEIENELHVDTSFTMYDRQTVDRLLRDNPELLPQPSVDIPKDLRWNRQKIQGAIEQGILQGESIPKIARRMQKVTDMNKSAATRNARTAMTGAQNGGRIESYKRAESLGIKMKMTWVATMDSRVRHSHAVMDGETQEVGKEFSNGCMYPGDPNGPPAETWNCRCTLIAQLKGFEHDVSKDRFSKLDNMSYDEWKDYHRQALDKKQKNESNTEEISHTRKTLEDAKVQYNAITKRESPLSINEIINNVGGGDLTAGSCSSLGFCYIGNRNGFDVLDFRDGTSRQIFSRNGTIKDIANLKNVKSYITKDANDFHAVSELLKNVETDKEYFLSTGKHATIVRKVISEDGKLKFEYLELQSSKNNGYFRLTNDVLKQRFGCKKSHTVSGYKLEAENVLIDCDSLKGNSEFEKLLGYINTEKDKQRKGKYGTIK